MIKAVLVVFVLTANAIGMELVHFGMYQYDDSIYTQKDVKKLSAKFLEKPYKANTLSSVDEEEKLVINLEAFDCFTYIDTIEALKNSSDFFSFKTQLIHIRYQHAKVSYENRRHFFSDWLNSGRVRDITCQLGTCKRTTKYLNKDEKYLQGIATKTREIAYISAEDIDVMKLKNGDYVGIYTKLDDLDVTHTGIIIKKEGKIYLRHASTKQKKVIDSDFFEYMKNKPGVVLFRSINEF